MMAIMETPEVSGLKIEQTIPSSDTLFKNAAQRIITDANTIQSTNYDQGPDRKFLHSSEHPLTLTQRAESLGNILQLTPRQKLLTEMAIAGHDTVIEVENPDPGNLLGMIVRNRGAKEGDKPSGKDGNEAQSSLYLEGEMRRVNHTAGTEIFSEQDIETVQNAIEATYPIGEFKNFEDSPFYQSAANNGLKEVFDKLKERDISGGLLISQPHLEKPLEEGKHIKPEVLVMGLVDLEAAGSAEASEFFHEGDSEMRELYENLTPDQMKRLMSTDGEVARADREKVSGAFLKWLYTQPGFATWQGIRFEKIMHGLRETHQITPDQEGEIRTIFSRYKENALAALDRADSLKLQFEKLKNEAGEKNAFTFLVESLGYENSSTHLPEEAHE